MIYSSIIYSNIIIPKTDKDVTCEYQGAKPALWKGMTQTPLLGLDRENHHDCNHCYVLFSSDEAKKILDVLEHLGYRPSLNELQIVKDVCDMISMRSARLAAAGLATIIKVRPRFHAVLVS